jgi:hypothetical protein
VRTKVKGDTISVWNRNASDEDEKQSIKEDFLKALNAPEGLNVEYNNFSENSYEKKGKKHYGGGGGRKYKKDEDFHRS